ncbi:restriction endonuclease subunit S [Brochothrix thermosphacta]|uniref:restriction endonuclease subunit S n=1 Tax=Brochothrix thermosphacta TaxID=2756 RepID=UPI000A1A3A36|nr:restriction endonuclease subunit S [Brochothrix thermosphacta]SLM97553.1 Type I restriction-modification system, specificity subunit S [Brachybacterium faecium]HCZ46428.1 restriction endonuclease subunit S [Brochothrix thermosphacta]
MANNIPEVRFEEFSGEWEKREIGDLANRYDNLRVPITAASRVSGKTPYYGANGIQGYVEGYTHNGEYILIAEDGASDLKNYPIQYVSGEIWVNNHAHVLQGKQGISDNKFLMNAIRNTNIEPFLVGGGRAKLNAAVMMKINLSFPLIEEQSKIGDFFKQLDDTIALQQQELDTLKQTKQGFLQKMFPKEGKTVPEVRFEGFSGEWKERKLGEVIEGMYNGQTPSRDKKVNWNGDINWLTSGELTRGIVTETIEKITSEGQKNALLKFVSSGTFVMAITGLEAAGTRGNCAKLSIDTTMNQSCMAIYPDKTLLDSNFLFQWYRKFGEEYGLKYTQGTKQQSYNAEIIKILPITLPKIEEQKKISIFLDELDDTIALHQRELEVLKETKQAFLQKMFV